MLLKKLFEIKGPHYAIHETKTDYVTVITKLFEFHFKIFRIFFSELHYRKFLNVVENLNYADPYLKSSSKIIIAEQTILSRK